MTFRHTNLIHYLSVFTSGRNSLRWRLLAVMGGMFLITLAAIGMSVFYFIYANERDFWQERRAEMSSDDRTEVEAVGDGDDQRGER